MALITSSVKIASISNIAWRRTFLSTKWRITLTFISMTESVRAKSNLDYIATNAPQQLTNYYFINYTKANTSHTLVPPKWYNTFSDNSTASVNFCWKSKIRIGQRFMQGINNILAKFLFALRFFLYETDDEWFWRGTDDTVIDFHNFEKFIGLLYSEYDPKEPIFLGNCIEGIITGHNFPYLQGGSGVLMSRRAAELLEPLLTDSMGKACEPDDIFISRLINNLNYDWKKATSPYFIGHTLLAGTVTRSMCSNVSYGNTAKMCRYFESPVSDVVFYHAQWHDRNDFAKSLSVWETLRETPPNIKWYMSINKVELCYDNKI